MPTLRMVGALTLVLAIGLGCVQRIGDFTIASTKNVAFNPIPERHRVEGKDCSTRLLGLIPIDKFIPNLEDAVDEAMAEVPSGNTMTNAAIYIDSWTAIVVAQQCYRVRGDVGTIQ